MNKPGSAVHIRPGQRHARRGFGIVDVMVGFSLILSGFLFCLGLLPATDRGMRCARTNLMATHFAESQLEAVRSLPFADITTTTPAPMTLTAVVNGSSTSVVYTPHITVTTIGTSLKDVVCTVTWKDEPSSTVTRRVLLETLVVNKN